MDSTRQTALSERSASRASAHGDSATHTFARFGTATVGAPDARSFALNISRRNGLLIGSGITVFLLAALLAVLLTNGSKEQRTILVAKRDLPAGTVLVLDDLRTTEIAADAKVRATDRSEYQSLIGLVTQQPIPKGAAVLPENFASSQKPPAGTVLVGVSLEAGALPLPNLRFGDTVRVLTSSEIEGQAISQELGTATVFAVWNQTDGSARRTLTLAVPDAQSGAVAAAAGAGTVRLIVLGQSAVPSQRSAPVEVSGVGQSGLGQSGAPAHVSTSGEPAATAVAAQVAP